MTKSNTSADVLMAGLLPGGMASGRASFFVDFRLGGHSYFAQTPSTVIALIAGMAVGTVAPAEALTPPPLRSIGRRAEALFRAGGDAFDEVVDGVRWVAVGDNKWTGGDLIPVEIEDAMVTKSGVVLLTPAGGVELDLETLIGFLLAAGQIGGGR